MIRKARAANDPWRARPARVYSHALWAGTGFIAGIAFWHFVGFWSLVSTAVVGDVVRTSPIASRPDAAKVSTIETGSIRRSKANPGCVALLMDRTGRVTRQAPCSAPDFHAVDGGFGKKDDLGPRFAPPSDANR